MHSKTINQYAVWVTTLTSLLLSNSSISAEPMKCVNGSGRVIYTQMDSCIEAFRAEPPSPQSPKSQALIESEQRVKESQEKARFYRERAARTRSDARKRALDMEYRERQRLMEEDEAKQKKCAAMLVESDRKYNEAMLHPSDKWMLQRSESFDQSMEQQCGHEVRLRR